MKCISCNSSLNRSINFGKYYKCSDFFKKKSELKTFNKNNLSLSNCKKCHLIQLNKPIFYKNIVPYLKWIKNKEEDNYHNDYIKKLIKEKKIKKNFKILGISNYDSTFLESLKSYGYKNIKILSIKKDLKIHAESPERQEVIQNFLNKKNAKKFLNKNFKYDLIVCSKLLEHSQSIKKVFEFFKYILDDKGYLIIDIPESSKSLAQGNLPMVWEEHISYFTNNTLMNVVNKNNFVPIMKKKYFFQQEDNLVFLLKKKSFDNSIILKDKNKFKIFKKKNLYSSN